MNPNQDQEPTLNLPPPSLERSQEPTNETAQSGSAPSAPEKAPGPQTPPTATPPSGSLPPVIPPVNPLMVPGAVPTASVQPPSNPLGADDSDLIEKEWVEKAKAIVARTIDDPYKQNYAVNQIKADYMKKRYNKDIKLTQE